MSPPDGEGGAPRPGSAPETATAKQDYLIPGQLSGQVPGFRGMISRPQLSARGDFWVLTKVTDDLGPSWEKRISFYGPPERLPFDLSQGVPPGWELLKGEAARQFMKNMIRDELQW